MTETPAYPGYATPTFTGGKHDSHWSVKAQPWDEAVGKLQSWDPLGWTAWDPRGMYVGLFPDKQAAGEALVKHAGYGMLR